MATVTETKSVESAVGPVVHKGRWGFHACDYPTFLAIKSFHKLVFRDLRATRRLKRWEMKMPHNRVRRHRDGTVDPVPQPKCLGTERATYLWVLAEYQKARRPMGSAEEVVALDLPRKWEEWHEKLKVFYGVQ